MSYYSRVEIQWDDTESPKQVEVDALLHAGESIIQEQDWHQDVLDDLRSALKGTENDAWGFNHMGADLVEDLLSGISRAFPRVLFVARGCGEELVDTWYRDFKDGQIIRREGPFGDT